MASARLSSSRNCENSGANLMVSFCALRRFHHFPMDTESDTACMNRRTGPRNFPKNGVFAQISAKSRFITHSTTRLGKWGLLDDREGERLLNPLAHLSFAPLGGDETHAGG